MKKTELIKDIIITGYGTVAKEFLKIIQRRNDKIKEHYGVSYRIIGIVGSKGMIYEEKGIDLSILLTCGKGSAAIIKYASLKGLSLQEPRWAGDVLVECSPTNLETGEPALSYIKSAIRANMHIVSVSKGALVQALPELQQLAAEHHCQIKYSGATAAALPTMDIGEFSLAGSEITSVEGILNGTSNFILSSMSEENLTFEAALKIAQDKGIAEANPALDIKGFDSAYKILLIANGLFHTQLTLNDVTIEGIQHVTKKDMQYAKINGNEIKLLASAKWQHEKLVLTVSPETISPDNPLIHVKGTNKGILFHTEEMGTICCLGGASHPKGAAAAAIKDMTNLFRNRES